MPSLTWGKGAPHQLQQGDVALGEVTAAVTTLSKGSVPEGSCFGKGGGSLKPRDGAEQTLFFTKEEQSPVKKAVLVGNSKREFNGELLDGEWVVIQS